jgi:lactate dehydrogenase-like 2-hydroxyacid dehydrogenase
MMISPAELLRQLRLIASTGPGNASIDVAAARELGITVTHTGYSSSPTIELTWAFILASVRGIVQENSSIRHGGWQNRWAKISREKLWESWDLAISAGRSHG